MSTNKVEQGPPSKNALETKCGRASRLAVSDAALIGIFIIMLLFVLKYAAAIFIPLTLAILLSLLFSPVVHLLEKIHITKRIGAAIVVACIVAAIAGGVLVLSKPAYDWLDQSPHLLSKIERKLQTIKKPIKQVQEAAEKVEGLAEIDEKPSQLIVRPETKKLFTTLFLATPNLLAFIILSIILLYFMLFSGKTLAEYLIQAIFWFSRQPASTDMGHYIQQELSRYLLTITIINCSLGIVTASVLAVIGLPNPVLWGTMAAFLNYAPYIGAIFTAIILMLISFVTFDSLAYSVLAPLIFVLITTLEGQVITPQILGSRFSLNPLLVFLSIIVWGWLWGYLGALIAVPLFVSVKIICESIDVLHPLAHFLGNSKKYIKNDT